MPDPFAEFESKRGYLMGVGVSMGWPRDRVEDAIGAVALRVYEKVATGEYPAEKFTALVYTSLKREITERKSQAATRRVADERVRLREEAELRAREREDFADQLLQRQHTTAVLQTAIEKVIAGIPQGRPRREATRILAEMVGDSVKTQAELGRELGLTEAAVKQRMGRLRAKLRAVLGHESGWRAL